MLGRSRAVGSFGRDGLAVFSRRGCYRPSAPLASKRPTVPHALPLGSPRHPAATYPFRRVGAGPQGAVNTRPASRSAASLRLAAAGSLSVFDQSQPRVR